MMSPEDKQLEAYRMLGMMSLGAAFGAGVFVVAVLFASLWAENPEEQSRRLWGAAEALVTAFGGIILHGVFYYLATRRIGQLRARESAIRKAFGGDE